VISAPGVKASDIKISVEDGANGRVMSMKGQTTTPSGTHTHVVNFSVALPVNADFKKGRASHTDGLLHVILPKKAVHDAAAVKATVPFVAPENDDEDEPKYTIAINAAGISARDLQVKAEAQGDGAQTKVLFVHGETRRTGAQVDRRFKLPWDADVEHAYATHVDGMLTVIIPKNPPAQTIILVNAHDLASSKESRDESMSKPPPVPEEEEELQKEEEADPEKEEVSEEEEELEKEEESDPEKEEESEEDGVMV